MKRCRFFSFVLITAFLTPSLFSGSLEEVGKSVVKIFATEQEPDYLNPWQRKGPVSITGSGCIVQFKGEKLVLTNAHCVADQRLVLIMLNGRPGRVPADVVCAGHEADLALLRPRAPFFSDSTPALTFGGLPLLREKVVVVGFPVGGDQLSFTEGVVSRIDLHSYAHSDRNLLTIQTDAAVNPGNSGGPFLRADNGELIGLAFQGFVRAQNIGYCIPAPVIRTFMEDVADGRYDGVPFLGVRYETLENRDLRAFLGLASQTGVRVAQVAFGGAADGYLKPGDVLTQAPSAAGGGSTAIANDGTVEFPALRSRINFAYCLHHRRAGDTVEFKIVRDRKPGAVKIPLKTAVHLVEPPRYDRPPRYFIYAGLVFAPLTNHLIDAMGLQCPASFRDKLDELPTREKRETVVLQSILDHPVNQGYDWADSRIVERINGMPIAEFKDVPRAFAGVKGEHHQIVLDRDNILVLNRVLADKASAEILKNYGIEKSQQLE